MYYSVQLEPTARTNRGHTGGGKHRGFFLVFWFLFCPTVLLRCLPSFLSREGFGRMGKKMMEVIDFCCFGSSGGSCARERKRATHAMGIILNSYFCAMGVRDGSGGRGWHVKVTNDVSEIYSLNSLQGKNQIGAKPLVWTIMKYAGTTSAPACTQPLISTRRTNENETLKKTPFRRWTLKNNERTTARRKAQQPHQTRRQRQGRRRR